MNSSRSSKPSLIFQQGAKRMRCSPKACFLWLFEMGAILNLDNLPEIL